MSSVAAGEPECEERGGAKVAVGSGTPTFVCNGETGFTKTLPSGAVERGTWAIAYTAAEGSQLGAAGISFGIPLETAAAVHFIGAEEGEGESKENLPAGCAGTFEHPVAQKGSMCIFAKAMLNATSFFGTFLLNPEGSSGKTGLGGIGVVVTSEGAGNVLASGTWIVAAS